MLLLRSMLAIIAGFITMNFIVIALTLVSIATMHISSGHPPPGYLIVNVLYSLLAAASAGFVTALVAGYRPLTHAGVLAGIMLVFGLFSYKHYTGTQPLWYQWLMIAVGPLCVIGGAAIYHAVRPRTLRRVG